MRKSKNELNRLIAELAEIQNKYESIKTYTDEVKQNLDAARKENHEHIFKIEELIKEKIQLANELNQAVNYNEKEDLIDKENRDSNLFDTTPVFYRNDASKSEIKYDSNDIDEKLQGILTKCIFLCLYRQKVCS